MNIEGLLDELTFFATLYIEDVAEKPERCARAQELVKQRITEVLKTRGLLGNDK